MTKKMGFGKIKNGLITSHTLQGDSNYVHPLKQKKGNKIIGRHLIKGYGFDVIVKDKTIKSPIIQSRYTWSNWCVALWRAGERGLCVGWRGFGKHRGMDCCIPLTHPDKVIARVQTSEGPRRELNPLYNRLWWAPEELRMWKPPINVKVISVRRLKKSMGEFPRGSLWFVTWTFQTALPHRHGESGGYKRAGLASGRYVKTHWFEVYAAFAKHQAVSI